MKKLLISIALMCSIASATKVNIDMSQKRNGDVWTVASYGYITGLDHRMHRLVKNTAYPLTTLTTHKNCYIWNDGYQAKIQGNLPGVRK